MSVSHDEEVALKGAVSPPYSKMGETFSPPIDYLIRRKDHMELADYVATR